MSTAWVECWKCDECGHRWIKTEVWPEQCPKRPCRSRNWNKLGLMSQASAPATNKPVAPAPLDKPAVPVVKMNPAMERFMQGVKITEPEPFEVVRTPCPKVGYDHPDGEGRRCRLDRGHKGNCAPGEKVD